MSKNKGGNEEVCDATEFGDLSHRANFFRSKVVEEFRLKDEYSYDSKTDPKYTTSELFGGDGPDVATLNSLLKENPQQLVKFKIFKRSKDEAGNSVADKRLVRVKNIDTLPLGVWANWITSHKYFTWLIFSMVTLSALVQGLQTEIDPASNVPLMNALDVIDIIIVVTFCMEIVLKWIDNFKTFWLDGWNIFDFAITFMSALPLMLAPILSSSATAMQSLTSQIRLFRTFRILKVFAKLGSLRVVISTLLGSMLSLSFVLMLLVLVGFLYALLALNFFAPYATAADSTLQYQDRYSTLPQTAIGLWQGLTYDSWFMIQLEIRQKVNSTIVWVFYVSWIFLGGLVFRNVFIGVVVNKFHEMSKEVERMIHSEKKARHNAQRLNALKKELEKQNEAAVEGETVVETREDNEDEAAASGGSRAGSARIFRMNTQRIQLDSERMVDDLERWQATVAETLQALQDKTTESVWPRDMLLGYLQIMEKLQNNMREYQELQYLASAAVHQVLDSN